MTILHDYIQRAGSLTELTGCQPWEATEAADSIVYSVVERSVSNDMWVNPRPGLVLHSTASVSPTAIIDAPVVIGPRTHVSHGAYLRGGVWLDEDVMIGTHCEIKSSFVFAASRIAHLNYVGNSVVGGDVNIEAGAVLANHWNERRDRSIVVRIGEGTIETNISKFGALLGDGCRIGANAVTSPGTVLRPRSVVGRLELIDQSNY